MAPTHAPHLDARRFLPPGADGIVPRPGGEFVLYWMQATFRAHDNFALNEAIAHADALGVPVLVYHGLRADYPWASDRLHTFILESVVDLAAGFAEKGIQYAFHLDRRGAGEVAADAARAKARGAPPPPGASQSPLVQLADRAALVVTDYLPTFIHPRQTRRLRERTATPVVAVDSACLVPMAAHQKEHLAARGMRTALLKVLDHHLWPVANPEPRVRRAVALPFEPLVPSPEAIPALVAGCAIDHAVPPARAIRGGTRAARARLARFLEAGLHRYADERSDPNEPEAVSGLSPYLHFGNVSIHEVLLAARAAGPAAQYDKFQDEALVWREISHNFCHWNPRHRTVEGIPAWAREQLQRHEADPRPALYTDEELEHARTDDPLWNACQRAYLVDGYMHNYLRMLWGKAVLAWTPDAASCLRILEHLNNKYALDGRDANSYGGIHWTFGKFDRPFYRRPIYGTVRYQSLRAAEGKFDVRRYIAGK
ncbi:MAG: deoxyribodipyrimidine photo-lyase [Gemmatimonadales bacterium]|nr:deoxyribodipyrimidine photo-lyase [Gemmatimonadales bacterium]